MADALCGPSNALQNFQKHSTADRTLQQDRLTARHTPSQGFRSSPGPSQGLLDPEFEAFQAGQLPLQRPEAQAFNQIPFRNASQPQLGQVAAAAWAADFQQLSISGPSAQEHFVRHNFAPQSGWQNEFQKQHQAAGPSNLQHANYNVPLERLSTIAPMAQGWQPMQMQNGPMAMGQAQIEQPQAQKVEAFDEEAFARAFDQAAQAELEGQELQQDQSERNGQEILLDESAARLLDADPGLQQERLGADLIHNPDSTEEVQRQDDPDALARTAGQLLDSVKDNQSSKFQNSQFLNLMRQLRDKEVMVEGDKIVGVHTEKPEDAEALEVAAP